MRVNLHYADYIVFAGVLFASALAGPIYLWLNRKRTTTTESYYLANRSMNVIPIAISLFTGFWSATTLIGTPAELYTGGSRFFMSSVGGAVGNIVGAIFVVPLFYNLKLLNTYQYLEMRFQSTAIRYICTLVGVVTRIFGLAVSNLAPCTALAAVTPIPFWASVIVTSAVALVYTSIGGIKAVIYVDIILAGVVFAACLLTTITGYVKLDGSFSNAMKIAADGGRLEFADFNPDPRNTYSNDPATLSPALKYLFSISYYLYPLVSLIIGTVVAIIVSLFTGGLIQAQSVEQRVLIVKNCFLREHRVEEGKQSESKAESDHERIKENQNDKASSSTTEEAISATKHASNYF